MERIGVLFVCLGNICRSPLAEGVFRHLVVEKGFENRLLIDSAGTSSWHIGSPPDSRGQNAALLGGFDIGDQRARILTRDDFETFHYILGMDENNLAHMRAMDPGGLATVGLLLKYSNQGLSEVPDPYYGDVEEFQAILELVGTGAKGLLEAIEREHFS